MDDQYLVETKKKFIDEQMVKFWEFCNSSQAMFQERERWECENIADTDYENDTRVIADSIREYSTIFFNGLTEILKTM